MPSWLTQKKIFTVASADQHLRFLCRLFLENPILFTPIFVRKQWSLYYQPKQCTSVKGNPSKLPHICIVWYLQNWQSNGPLLNPPFSTWHSGIAVMLCKHRGHQLPFYTPNLPTLPPEKPNCLGISLNLTLSCHLHRSWHSDFLGHKNRVLPKGLENNTFSPNPS